MRYPVPEATAGAAPKVLRVITRLNIGGPAQHAIILHKGLVPLGWSTRLVYGQTGAGEGSFEGLLDRHKCPPAVKLASLGPRIAPLQDLQAFVRLLRLVFAERPDVVHTHTAKAGTLGRLAALAYNATRRRRERCLVVHTFHGNVLEGYFGPMASKVVRAAERALAAATDAIVTISPRQRSEIADRFHIARPESVSVIRLGLDLHAFRRVGDVTPEFRRRLGFADDSVLFAAVGRLVPIKDFPTLLHAFALARRQAAEHDLRLVIAGDGEERGALSALAQSLGLDDAVRFLGWQDDLPETYRGVDAVALSSRNEGTPVTLIEALAAGRPVVATAVGGVPDVVRDRENGLLVPPADPPRMAEALVCLARNPVERRRLGEAGRLVAGEYDQERLVADVTALYECRLLEKRGCGAQRT